MKRMIAFAIMMLCFLVAGVSIYEIISDSSFLKKKDIKIPSNVPNAKNKLQTAQVSLKWDKVQDAISYNVYWSETPGVNKSNGNNISTTTNSVTVSNLNIGTVYYFVVTAVNGFEESDVSKEISYTIGQ